jgi:hypothetical protein
MLSGQDDAAALAWAFASDLESQCDWRDPPVGDCTCSALGCDDGSCFTCVSSSYSTELAEYSEHSSPLRFQDDEPMEEDSPTPDRDPPPPSRALQPISQASAQFWAYMRRSLRCPEKTPDALMDDARPARETTPEHLRIAPPSKTRSAVVRKTRARKTTPTKLKRTPSPRPRLAESVMQLLRCDERFADFADELVPACARMVLT